LQIDCRHIPVAIKVLRQPLDEVNPHMTEEFMREVKFMRSIRHPHLLLLYGAGMDEESRAFLVTELMVGSLRALLLDNTKQIDWATRLQFAVDAASGMK
jgi:serine/threonine protein kinase